MLPYDDKGDEITMALPVVAVVGRPNVGKSTLFNKLIGQRLSIVEDTPGVTRDRIYAKGEWRDRSFMLVDTGGIETVTDDVILKQMRRQAELAIERADVIVLVTDVRCGVTADDSAVASMLQKSGKPVVLAVNKCDSIGEPPMELYEFYNLGIGDPFPISAAHGHGTGDMLDAVYDLLPPEDELEDDEDAIHVAIIGKPNVGKSSLVNLILGEKRVIVSNVAGTTRDSVDTRFENKYGKYIFVDTAGIRRKSRVDDRIEKFSVMRAKLAIERADVCLIMIDARDGVTEQDTKIAGLAHEAGKASIIVVNKWDTVEKDNGTVKAFTDRIRTSLAYMPYAPIVFVSVKTGQRVDDLYDLIKSVYEQANRRINTGALNDVLGEAMMRVQPPTDKGRRLKIYYMTQSSVAPPTFVLFCNDAELFHFSYQRYIENCLRTAYGFAGTPIVLVIKQRGEDPDIQVRRPGKEGNNE